MDDHHHDVCVDLKHLDLPDLVQLGGALGISHNKCKRFSNVGDFVSSWLKREDKVLDQSGEPTWSKLADALEEIGQKGIAQDIRSKHAKEVPQASHKIDQSSSSSAGGHPLQIDTGKYACCTILPAKSHVCTGRIFLKAISAYVAQPITNVGLPEQALVLNLLWI